jgi:hypothetical protein
MSGRELSNALQFGVDDVVKVEPVTPTAPDVACHGHTTAKEELERLLILRSSLQCTRFDESASILDQHLDDIRRTKQIIDIRDQIEKLTEIVLAELKN